MRRFGAAIAATFVFTTVLVLVVPSPAQASHFRFGNLSWRARADLSPSTVEFTLTAAFRRCGYSGTAPDGCPAVGDVIEEFIGFTQLLPGDGTSIGDPLDFEVIAINPVQDWLLARAERPGGPDEVIVHEYPSPTNDGQPWVASIDTCCRIFTGDHINNSSGSYRVETLVELSSGNHPPVSALPPIVSCELGTVCEFFALATDADDDRLRWRLSQGCEAAAGCGFTQPGPPHAPNALEVDPDTGLVTWDTTGATIATGFGYGLYSTQITIEDLDAAGEPRSKTAVDFFIRVAPVPPHAPTFDSPPSPEDGSTLTAPVGEELLVILQASDPDEGDILDIGHAGLPQGMTCNVSTPPGNPFQRQCRWTPDATQVGSHIVVFIATDSFGLSDVLSVEIVVEGRESFEIDLTTFIPGNHIRQPFHCRQPLTNLKLDLLVRTDDRGFEQDADTYRTRQEVEVAPLESADADGLVSGPVHLTRPTRAYAEDALFDDGRITDADDDGVPGDCVLFDREAQAPIDRMNVSVQRVAEDRVVVFLSGGPGQPLFFPPNRPEISWSLQLLLDASGDEIEYTLTGRHDGFPAYELYVGDERIYEFWPGDPPYGARDLAKLFPPEEIDVLETGTLGEG